MLRTPTTTHNPHSAAGPPVDTSLGSNYLPSTSWIGGCSATIQLLDLDADQICSLNAAEQRELSSRMEKKQMKEFMTVSLPFLPPACRAVFSKHVVFTNTP